MVQILDFNLVWRVLQQLSHLSCETVVCIAAQPAASLACSIHWSNSNLSPFKKKKCYEAFVPSACTFCTYTGNVGLMSLLHPSPRGGDCEQGYFLLSLAVPFPLSWWSALFCYKSLFLCSHGSQAFLFLNSFSPCSHSGSCGTTYSLYS